MSRLRSAHVVVALLTCLLKMTGTAQDEATWYLDDDAPNDPGPGDPSVSDPSEDGSAAHPFDAIQEGIDATVNGDTVLVLDGTYTGDGNRDLDYGGRLITVRSENGPENCVIDCQQYGRGFFFHNEETGDAVVEGLTVTNGWDLERGSGGGMYNENCSPTVINCTFTGNFGPGAFCQGYGGGICNWDSSPTVLNCTFRGNSGGAVSSDTGADLTITSSILWGDSPHEIDGGETTVTYSDVQGGWPGTGNIDADPLFVRNPEPGPDGE